MAKLCSFHGCRIVAGKCPECEEERKTMRWVKRMAKLKDTGRFLPRRKKNFRVPEEGPAEHVANAIQIVQAKHDLGEPLSDDDIHALLRRLHMALRMLREGQGRMRNPATLAIVNPPGGRVMGDKVYEIAYRHTHDGEDYIHEFEKPDRVRLVILSPSQVLLDGGRMPIVDLFDVGGK